MDIVYIQVEKMQTNASEIEDTKTETTEKQTTKQTKGVEIAKQGRILKRGHEWIVPSQSGQGNYSVTMKNEGRYQFRRCTCADYELKGQDCKHIYAVMYMDKLLPQPLLEVKEPKKQSVQNWSAYNKSQIEEKDTFLRLLAELVEVIPEPAGEATGRPRVSMREAVFISCLKVYTTVSCRRFMSDMRFAMEKGHISKGCSFSSISKYMKNEEMKPSLEALIKLSALPLQAVETKFAVDSTGFRTTKFNDYWKEKYNVRRPHVWLKCHAMIGTKTNIVTGADVQFGSDADSPHFVPLVQATANSGFNIEEVSADKAYGSMDNYNTVAELGGTAYIPFKKNILGKSDLTSGVKGRVWRKMLHLFLFSREEFLQHYHQRSNVESTFNMIKAKFTDLVRSKDRTAQVNEVLLKILCHNIVVVIHEMNELGVTPQLQTSIG